MNPEQFQNLSPGLPGLDPSLFQNFGFPGLEGILQPGQNMGSNGFQQNGMLGLPFSLQGGGLTSQGGGIPQLLQNIRLSLGSGNGFPGGFMQENNEEEEENLEEVDWDQIFGETFFPNGRPPDITEAEFNPNGRSYSRGKEKREEEEKGASHVKEEGGNLGGGEDSETAAMDHSGNELAEGLAYPLGDTRSRPEMGEASGGLQSGNSNQKRKAHLQIQQTSAGEKRFKFEHGDRNVNYDEHVDMPYEVFRDLLQKEKERALQFESDPQEDAQCTVILLDTSYSMRGEPFEIAVRIVKEFLTVLSNIPDLKENISLVTFGEDLRVHQHLTSDYKKINEALSGVRVCGQCNLSQGLTLCAPVLERLTKPLVNGVECSPRILLVSNFKGVESQELIKPAEDMMKNLHQDYSALVCCIPVVRMNQRVALQLAQAGDGTVVSPSDVSRLCNLYLQRLLAGSILGEKEKIITDETIHFSLSMLGFDRVINEEDVMMIKKIIRTTAPDRVGFFTNMAHSPLVYQVHTMGDNGWMEPSSKTKRVTFQDEIQEKDKVPQQENPLLSSLRPGMSGVETECSGGQEERGAYRNEICPAVANDNPIPESEDSDSECSQVDFSLENEDSKRDYKWLWRDDMGQWKTYPDDVNQKLERKYRHKPQGTCVVSHNGQAERVLFKTMKQRCSVLKKERDVKRLEVDPETMKELKSSFYGE